MSAAYKVMQYQKQLEKDLEAASSSDVANKEQLRLMLDAMWASNALDIQNTVSKACSMVLILPLFAVSRCALLQACVAYCWSWLLSAYLLQALNDKTKSKEELKQRAIALERMGTIFTDVGNAALSASASEDVDDATKQDLAQQRIEKALHETLEKMDRDEHGPPEGASKPEASKSEASKSEPSKS